MDRKLKGFTLLELIIAMTISAIAMTLIVSIFMTGVKTFEDSDVKTTLQMDAKDIQERISDICMQATSIKSVEEDEKSQEEKDNTRAIKKMEIDSYYRVTGNNAEPITIIKDEMSLKIDGFTVPSKVKSIAIDKDIVSESKKQSLDKDLSQFCSIKFNIVLESKERGINVEYPIIFTVKFRNK